jgi:tetratricopeptide (TPR) repeat protein
MLADAYRRSAYALREDESPGPLAARPRVSHQRFEKAGQLLEALAADLGQAPIEEPARSIYERLALCYKADCLYELNEPATLAEALAVYRQVAARYQGEPTALTAQVQIANVYLRQGKLTEAARAVERARWLLANVPDHAFAEYAGAMDRASWDRFLGTVRSSHLLEHVFAETR